MAVAWPAITYGRLLRKTASSKARRLQRQRQGDRALIAFAKANARLAGHHGSAPVCQHSAPMAPPIAHTHWECHKCHCWAPRGGKEYCNQCGHTAPAGVTAKRTARPAAQACGNVPPGHVTAKRSEGSGPGAAAGARDPGPPARPAHARGEGRGHQAAGEGSPTARESGTSVV